MLTKITLENFKVFRHATEFPLAKINLLTGINGRGKSSLLQSLLLMRQSIEHNENTTELILNGNCVHLGTWEDVKNKDEESNKEVRISLNFTNSLNNTHIKNTYLLLPQTEFIYKCKISRCILEYSDSKDIYIEELIYHNEYVMKSQSIRQDFINEINKDDEVIYSSNGEKFIKASIKFENLFPKLHNITENNHRNKFGRHNSFDVFDSYIYFFYDFFFHYHYISADRIGARDFYEKDLTLNHKFVTVEKTGKNVLDVIAHYKTREVNFGFYLEDGNNLLTQIGEWLGYVLDAEVAINLDDSNKFVNSFTYTINGKENLLPSNVGFGYSYILPIITAGLIAKEGEILIVENPEAHLHPKAQSRLTEFLAKVAATGVQVFVESHSEHILNGLRIATLKKDIDLTNEDVSVLYFQDVENQPFIRLNIEKDGSIKNWVEGFFDQQEIDLSEIFKLNRAKK
jgi:predicted ATPase